MRLVGAYIAFPYALVPAGFDRRRLDVAAAECFAFFRVALARSARPCERASALIAASRVGTSRPWVV